MTENARPSDLVNDNLPDEPWKNRRRPSLDELEEALRDVVDPELMVNIVDLGLVYGLDLNDDLVCTIDMTLTSPTCPMTDRLEHDCKEVLQPLVNGTVINWVWMPAWDLSRITEDGREQLRAVGFTI